MKKIIPFLTLAAMLPVVGVAQTTNTFPATGNVGIGTTAPNASFKLNIHTAAASSDNMVRLVHDGITGSNFQFGTPGTGYGVPAHQTGNVIESFRDLRIGAANANSNLFFETGRINATATVRMKITNTGLIGMGTESPQSQLHVNTSSATPFPNFFKITQTEFPAGYLQIVNGASSALLPTIAGRADAPSRTLGINVVGESNDIPTPLNEPSTAAIMLSARSNAATPVALTQANLLSINNYGVSMLMVKANGNIGIGTTSPGTNKLAVEGTIAARKVKVTQTTPWPDYVFRTDYRLPALEEVATHIKEKGHLPGIPTEAEVAANGHDLGDMNTKLLQKVEELTLYLLEMKAGNDKLKAENDAIRKRLEQLEKR